jgi:hypothetical protein
MNLLGKLAYKMIPENWYQTKRVCDLFEKICVDPILRNDIKIYMGIAAIMLLILATCFCFYVFYKIRKLKN